MNQTCMVCSRMIHDGDEIVAVVKSVFHEVPSSILYAIEPPSECYEMRHSWCEPEEETEI